MFLIRIRMKVADYFSDKTGLKHFRYPLKCNVPNGGSTVLEIPGYRQLDSYSCGAVAGLMIVHSIYPNRAAKKFYRDVSPNSVTGTSTTRLIRALRKNGIAVRYIRRGTLKQLKAAIDAGFPIATTVGEGLDLHWIVVYGYSNRPTRIFTAGEYMYLPCQPPDEWKEFKTRWQKEMLICWRR